MLAAQKVLADDFDDLADAWVVWVPTLANLTLGNGVVTARRRLIGKTVDFRFRFVLGSTSAVGTDPGFTLSHTPHSSYAQFDEIGWGTLLDAGLASRAAVGRLDTGATVRCMAYSSTGVHQTVTATVPWTWTTGDAMSVAGTFELA